MVEEDNDSQFYDQLCQLIASNQKKMSSATHGYEALREDSINYIEGAFYSNLIRLFEKNLNEDFFKMVKMNRRDRQYLFSILKPYFSSASETHDEVYNKGEVDFFLYQEFRKAVYNFGDDTYWLLLGVEKYADIIRCEHRIIQFKNDIL
jgi:hypothetical protein